MQVFTKQITNNNELQMALNIRSEVFVDEQGVDQADEYDSYDDAALNTVDHYLLMIDQMAVGTCRVVKNDNYYKIQRFCILKDYRRNGYASTLLNEVLAIHNDMTLKLSSQDHAVGFYERHGFKSVGEAFYECGIKHFNMIKEIDVK